eukprot:CAMPEP_0176287160 /NCGR_PEP_ID=MMETSP0121_2-20121125/53287_1 /TAXON_ID=160619 /ORGANISM="Kryptoperidinium foliaceum, Strain CCMP 1326" /LENGTH=74 /DNA_ID=CAMNT_0017627757 /DNA_START=97 /DNA_END=318 /DNA_ORIENTATION=-
MAFDHRAVHLSLLLQLGLARATTCNATHEGRDAEHEYTHHDEGHRAKHTVDRLRKCVTPIQRPQVRAAGNAIVP